MTRDELRQLPGHCPVCGGESFETSGVFGSKRVVFLCHDKEGSCQNAHDIAITLCRRIAQLEAGLNRIKSLADAPYAEPGTPGEALVDEVLGWAVNEADAALKETP